MEHHHPAESLRDVRKTVEQETQSALNWYWKKKPWKSTPSRYIQFAAVVLTALGGLASVIVALLKSAHVQNLTDLDSGQIATLCIGIAAALIGLDKAFGFSTGWTRYVLTATSITKMLQEFRLDWVAMEAVAAEPPTLQERAALIQRAKEFITGIQAMVLQETKDWATEFQSNMAQMEKDLKAQLDALKAQVENSAKAKEDTSKPGAIELTLTNAEKTDGFRFDVTLEGLSGTLKDVVSNAKVWTRIGVAPGQYKIALQAKVQNQDIGTSSVVEIKPGDTVKPSLILPIF